MLTVIYAKDVAKALEWAKTNVDGDVRFIDVRQLTKKDKEDCDQVIQFDCDSQLVRAMYGDKLQEKEGRRQEEVKPATKPRTRRVKNARR